jgi:MOSC domain-containing protein YiiM
VAIYVAGEAGVPMTSVEQAVAVPGAGLDGDRYAAGRGHYSGRPGSGRQVTLIEREAVEAAAADYGVAITPAASRRNLLTEGVALNHLVGREFTVGAVLLRGTRLCEPCAHLEALSAPGVQRALAHRGGLRAEVVAGGTVRVGDAIGPT